MTYHMMISQWSYPDGKRNNEPLDPTWLESCDAVGEGIASWDKWNNLIFVFTQI